MKTPEGYEKDKIKKYLTDIGAWYFCPFMRGYGKTGVPDIIACLGGLFVGIEVKRPGKEPTPIQQRRIAEIRAADGIAIAGTADDVIEYIEAI